MTNITGSEGALEPSTSRLQLCTWQIQCGESTSDSTIPVVASRSRHTRSTPQLPLTTPEVVPEKIIRKGKALREGTSTDEPGISDDFHYPHIGTPIFAAHSTVIPSVGVS
jgi:hypothetical protein